MKKLSIVLTLSILLLSGCSGSNDIVEESTTAIVGDFNFVEQAPVTTTSATGISVIVSGGSGEVPDDLGGISTESSDVKVTEQAGESVTGQSVDYTIEPPEESSADVSDVVTPSTMGTQESEHSVDQSLSQTIGHLAGEHGTTISVKTDIVSESTSPVTASTTTVTASTTPKEEGFVSSYKDLDMNVSLRLGTNVYVSVPRAQLEPAVNLSEFLEHQRLVFSRYASNEKYTEEVQRKVFENGTCIHQQSTVLFIEGYGFDYWCSNKGSSLDEAKNPSIKNFNIGVLTDAYGGSLEYVYSALGDKLEEEETEYYYRAVYEVADVAGSDTILTRAGLIFDKQTNTLVTCVIITNWLYPVDDYGFTSDIAISSLRYSTVKPDNIVKIS